jgi:GTP-binding protein HflX
METRPPIPRAILVGIQFPGVDDVAHAANIEELGRLVKTLGYEIVGTLSQKRDEMDGGTVLGKGRLEDLAAMTGGTGVVGSMAIPRKSKARDRFDNLDEKLNASKIEHDPEPMNAEFVIVDHEISPSQARNLERATGTQVLDRTGVIVEIFHRHAHSREAKLQVEMARLQYIAPRLRESSAAGERRQGYGAGESDLELNRRKIRDRLAELKEQLDDIQRDNDERRSARRDQLRVALIGYTNAGKSSLMRALTGSEVLVADKLFATLDTTVRALHPEAKPRVLISDTVGFIKKLPHDLVASFRSTLAEGLEASLLCGVLIEHRKRTVFHKDPLPVHDERIEDRERSSVADRVHAVVEQRPKLEQGSDMRVAAALPTRPCRHEQDHRRAVGTRDRADLDGQLIGQARRYLGKPTQNRPGFREGIDQHARDDVGQFVQTNAHLGHDAKISAAATQDPEQILFVARLGGDDTSVRQNDVGGDQIVERKTEAADQWPIAAAQGEPGHADRAA